VKSFCFESYGVNVRIESSSRTLLEEAISIARHSLLNRISEQAASSSDHVIVLRYRVGNIWMTFDGVDEGDAVSEAAWANYFDTRIRLLVGEYAPNLVFLHAGAVAWRGKAIILPGDSFAGKSTLVAELVRRGAEYLSDEYAILDSGANVHAFPRDIGMRHNGNSSEPYFLSPAALAAHIPSEPVPARLVLLAQYRARARWHPVELTHGQGVLEIIPHAISIRAKTRSTLATLKTLSTRAIILRTLRGDARNCSRKIIDFVDKTMM
jgi:hypothetical protein